jgi:hypothetical protein
MAQYIISLFNIRPKEHGKHTDIRTQDNTYIPMEQTWMEYKQNSNQQNEYPYTVMGGKKSVDQEKIHDMDRYQTLMKTNETEKL